MIKFNVLRYLKRFSLWIVLWTAFGVLMVHGYVQRQQTYTASAVLMDTGAAEKEINLNEITHSTVISSANALLGDRASGLDWRAICTVTPLTEEAAAVSVGKSYRVQLTVPGAYGEETARRALDALLQSYCEFYTEKYVAMSLPLRSSEGSTVADEPYSHIQKLEDHANTMLSYLQPMQEQYPQFRSAQTGFGFADLTEFYQALVNVEIPALYGQVMTSLNPQQQTLLKTRLQGDMRAALRREESRNAQKEKLLTLLQSYAKENDAQTILNGTLSLTEASSVQPTADRLILELVALDVEAANDVQNRSFMQEQLALLATSVQNNENSAALATAVQALEQTLTDGYALVSTVVQELNQVSGAEKLQRSGSIQVTTKLNETLYPALALVLFLLLGCGGAVVLGRLLEVRTALRTAMIEAMTQTEPSPEMDDNHA